MTTALYSHPDCHAHVTPPGHPEQVARLEAIMAALDTPEFAALDRREAPLADRADIYRAHPQDYVEMIQAAVPDQGWRALDADTHLSPGSWNGALRAAGAAAAAVDAVLAGEVTNAFCATRPPGHHAEQSTPMGFCLFGNVAIAAKRALDHHGLARVGIVDFDVHHGNGTQALLWDEPRILFASTHQMPLWPGSGNVHETGAANNIMNLPLPPGAGGAGMIRVLEREVMPAMEDFAPELLLISAGFDAHAADPLANLMLSTEDFATVTQLLCALAEKHCGGRVVSCLEGGYDLPALAASVAAHVTVLMEQGG